MKTVSLRETEPIFDRIRTDPRARVIQEPVLLILCFLLFLFTDLIIQVILYAGLMHFSEYVLHLHGRLSGSASLILMLYFTLPCVVLCFVCCGVAERRKIRTMGLSKHRIVRDYLLGAVVGVGMLGAAVMLIWLGGGVYPAGGTTSADLIRRMPWGNLLLFTCGWMIQGFSEELTFRGFFMMSAGTHLKPAAAVCISSLIFSCAHLLNDGISVFAIVNLTLFGIFAALYFLRTDSIWGVAALHSFWNMAQGNVFGLRVSGIEVQETFFRFTQTGTHTWLNGGEFGPEGGAAVTLVLVVGTLIVFALPQRASNPPIPSDAP